MIDLSPSQFDVLLTLIVLADATLTALYLAFPFRFDRAIKRSLTRGLLRWRLTLDLAVLAFMLFVLVRLVVLGDLRAPDEVAAYGLGLLILVLLQGLTLQLPATWLAKRIDQETLGALRSYADWVAWSLYGNQRLKADAFENLRAALAADTTLLEEYALAHPVRGYVEAEYIQPELGRYLLDRLAAAGDSVRAAAPPFGDLNFVVALLGLATLASLLLGL